MSSLADLPKLIGFFSYSRQDDEGDDGAITALANRIYRELRAQLGRSSENFKLWRDKDALAAGEHWKEKLNEAVSESVFFIQMVSPSVIQSHFCRFEFDSFIVREEELGRNDLVFPILYVSVPELEDKRKENDPVISTITERQYVDWRPIRHQDVNSPEVKRTVEQLCAVIARKLRAQWISPEERQAIEVRRRVEEEQRRQAEVAKRKAEEEERAQAAEAQSRADEERSKKEAQQLEQRRREEQEHADRERRAREHKQQQKSEPKRTPEVKEKQLELHETSAEAALKPLGLVKFRFFGMSAETAHQYLGWVLIAQGCIRALVTVFLMTRTDVPAAIGLWFLLAAFNIGAGYGFINRRVWGGSLGAILVGMIIISLNDLIFALLTAYDMYSQSWEAFYLVDRLFPIYSATYFLLDILIIAYLFAAASRSRW